MKVFLAVISIIMSLSSCYTYKMDIGKGVVPIIAKDSTKPAMKVVSVSKKKWYIMWGLAQLNTVDAKKMAKGAKDYSIKQRFKLTDILIGIPTVFFISTETVTVKKLAPILPKVKKRKRKK